MAENAVIAGIDINDKEVQICVYDEESKEVKSAPAGMASPKCIFPARLLYFPRTEKWRFGTEADFFANQKDGVMISDILNLCENQDEVFVGSGKNLETTQVAAELLRQVLSLAGIKNPAVQIKSLMVTMPAVTVKLAETFRKAFAALMIEKNAFIQSYDESFYYRAMISHPENFRNKAGMFLFDEENHVTFHELTLNRQTRPATATARTGDTIELPEADEERDRVFLDFAKEVIGSELFTSIYLVGRGFDKKWSPFSVAFLCQQGRRVFHGDNLYAGGACYAAREKTNGGRTLDGYMFLGQDILQKNIGLDLLENGRPVYVPLVSAGSHWYEAEGSCEMILDEPGRVVFRVDSLEKNKHSDLEMQLAGFPERPRKTTRLRITAHYENARECIVTVEDLGFGELFPATGRKWTETI
ncbi:MAG: hypothetical protein IKG08_01530 [Eubacterium sp.]|nr:hypothetical protein [Eubacterium sp.]